MVGVCKTLFDACEISQPCKTYRGCYQACNWDLTCIANCGPKNLPGAMQWLATMECLYCQECPHDCAAYQALCPFL